MINGRKKMDINEVKKDLYRSKNMAKFSHYVFGNLYYTIELVDGIYQFIIETVAEDTDATTRLGRSLLYISEDLGSTSFEKEMRGSELIRWIQKSIETNDFIKIG
jgi:hypothetical protein